MPRLRIGIDVGGTFTDLCLYDEDTGAVSVTKVPSTPVDASLGMLAGLQALLAQRGAQASDVVYLAHGTTVATNTLIQHNGARTGLLTTYGFRDLLEIGRQTRPDLYDLQIDKPAPLVSRDLRLEVHERVSSAGRVLTPLNTDQARAAIAVLQVDMRYLGQNYELTVPLPDGSLGPNDVKTLLHNFYQAHERTYGYYAADEPTQLVTFRLEALGVVPKASLPEYPPGTGNAVAAVQETRQVYLGKADGGFVSCPVYARQRLSPGARLSGPAIVEQMDSTTLILPGQAVTMDRWGTLVITLAGDTLQHDVHA